MDFEVVDKREGDLRIHGSGKSRWNGKKMPLIT